MNTTVQSQTVENVTFIPADESGPWVVEFNRSEASSELATWLENPDDLATVVVEIDEVPMTGKARINTGEITFTLVGRTDLVPVV